MKYRLNNIKNFIYILEASVLSNFNKDLNLEKSVNLLHVKLGSTFSNNAVYVLWYLE